MDVAQPHWIQCLVRGKLVQQMLTKLLRYTVFPIGASLLTLVLKFGQPHGGITIDRQWLVCFAIAFAYFAFSGSIQVCLAAIPDLFANSIKRLRFGANAKDGSVRLLSWSVPYAAVFTWFLLSRLLTGIMAIVILNRFFPQYVGISSMDDAVFLGSCFASIEWLAPLAAVGLVWILTIPLLVPLFVLLLTLDRVASITKATKNDLVLKAAKCLGYTLGSMSTAPFLSLLALAQLVPRGRVRMPPETVPDGLKPEEYYTLGLRYKEAGWIEHSRVALARTLALDPQGDHALKARRYLQTKLPRKNAPKEAVERNIVGYNQMAGGDFKGATSTFERLIEEYPEFEWPYSNLASIMLMDKKYQRARELIDKAIEINPSYLNAWLRLAELCKLEKNSDGTKVALDKALELDPDDHIVKLSRMREGIYDNNTSP